MPVGDPRLGGRHPGAERRRLRRRGGRHHHPGSDAGPAQRRRCAGRPPTNSVSGTGPACSSTPTRPPFWRWNSRWTPRPQRAPALRRAGRPRWTPRPASAPTPPRFARLCSLCGPARAWCSTRPTTTPGASDRFSPIPLSRSSFTKSWPTGPIVQVPHYPAPDGVKLAAGWLVEQAGFAKGYPEVEGAPCRLSTKHALAADQSRRGRCRRRARAGPHRARRSARCVWRHIGARAGAGRLLPVDHCAEKRVGFRRYLVCRGHRARRLAGHPAPGSDDPGGRRLRAQRVGRLRRRIDQAGRQGQTAGGSRADVPAGRQDHQGPADHADQRRGPRRLVPARRADQLGRQGGRRRPQPGPDALHPHRAARLRRDLHLEWLGGRVTTASPSR